MTLIFPHNHPSVDQEEDPRIDDVVKILFGDAEFPWQNKHECRNDVLMARDIIVAVYEEVQGFNIMEELEDHYDLAIRRLLYDPAVELEFAQEIYEIQGNKLLPHHADTLYMMQMDAMIDDFLADMDADLDDSFLNNKDNGDDNDHGV
jgi:hypothetical protein